MQQRNREERWHTDAWWMRLSEGRFTAEEARAWQEHLHHCAACREEWKAWREMEQLLATAPLPTPPSNFTEATLARWQAHRRRQRWMVIATLVILLPLVAVGSTLFFGDTLFYFVELLQRLIAVAQLATPMLARALVTLGMALRSATPWLAASLLILLLTTLLNGGLLAGSMVVLHRRSPRR